MTSSLFQHIRPDFEVRCKKWKVNPVTKMKEPHLPSTHKIARKASSLTVVFFMVSTCLICDHVISGCDALARAQVSCVLIAVFAIIMYRIIIVALLYASDDDVIKSNAKLATTATAACINLIVILLFNRVSFAMLSSMMSLMTS